MVRVMESSSEYFRTADGMTLLRRTWVPAHEPRAHVIFVHGQGDHSGRHEPLLVYLAAAGYAAHALDLRGHGRSQGRRGHINAWTEFHNDIGTLRRRIAEDGATKPLFLVGFSLGALIALDYGLRYPDQTAGIVAIGPPIGEIGISPLLLRLAKIMSGLVPRLSMKMGMDDEWLSRDSAAVRRVQDDPLSHGRATARLGTEYMKTVQELHRGAERMTVPFVIFHGGADRIAEPDGSRRFYERSGSADKQLIVYDGAYHELDSDTCAEQLKADLVTWINERLDS